MVEATSSATVAIGYVVGVVGLAQGPGSADEERVLGGLDEIADLVAEAHIDQVAIGQSGRGDGLGAEFLLASREVVVQGPEGRSGPLDDRLPTLVVW